MIIRPAVYEEKTVTRRFMVTHEVYGCDCCEKEFVNDENALRVMIHDRHDDVDHPVFCSWACVFKYFQSEPLVGFATLPYLTVENREDFLSALKRLKD